MALAILPAERDLSRGDALGLLVLLSSIHERETRGCGRGGVCVVDGFVLACQWSIIPEYFPFLKSKG